MIWKRDSDPEEVAVVISFWDMTREARAEERSVMFVGRMICEQVRVEGSYCTLLLQAGPRRCRRSPMKTWWWR